MGGGALDCNRCSRIFDYDLLVRRQSERPAPTATRRSGAGYSVSWRKSSSVACAESGSCTESNPHADSATYTAPGSHTTAGADSDSATPDAASTTASQPGDLQLHSVRACIGRPAPRGQARTSAK